MPPKQPVSSQKGAPSEPLKVIGSSFLAETYTMCTLLDLNQVTYTFEEVKDIFSLEGQNELKQVNPGEQTLTLVDGGRTIIADPATLYSYVCKT